MSDLHFVFLQGMPSPFFTRIAKELTSLGCKTTGINFCLGDWLFWQGSNSINYKGSLDNWGDYIANFFDSNNVSDIVLLGEQRSYHKIAIQAAKSRHIRVTVTDFGYLRPDWITLEKDGMSGNSLFPNNMDEIRRLNALCPKVDLKSQYADSALKMSINDLIYILSNVFGRCFYPKYRRSDKRPHPFIYLPLSAKQLFLTQLNSKLTKQKVQFLLNQKSRFFIFPLQLEHDFQIIAYSPFNGLYEAIETVLASFALFSDPGTYLVVKMHPWEPGLRNWKKYIATLADTLQIQSRIIYLDGGNLDEMIVASEGMVTVNSTSGLKALQLNCPVKTLGSAIYNLPGLTYQGGLDNFWKEKKPVEVSNVQAFINVLAASIQIRGVFFNEQGLQAATQSAVQRLYTKTVGMMNQ